LKVVFLICSNHPYVRRLLALSIEAESDRPRDLPSSSAYTASNLPENVHETTRMPSLHRTPTNHEQQRTAR
ncbi:MAG: hypothetical protein WBH57_01475, partial [Anaerolineae bacterium]